LEQTAAAKVGLSVAISYIAAILGINPDKISTEDPRIKRLAATKFDPNQLDEAILRADVPLTTPDAIVFILRQVAGEPAHNCTNCQQRGTIFCPLGNDYF
jgi:hypothetical protein